MLFYQQQIVSSYDENNNKNNSSTVLVKCCRIKASSQLNDAVWWGKEHETPSKQTLKALLVYLVWLFFFYHKAHAAHACLYSRLAPKNRRQTVIWSGEVRAAVQSLRRCADEDARKIETGIRSDTHTGTHHISSWLGRQQKQRETIYCADKGGETPAALKCWAEERKRESATAAGASDLPTPDKNERWDLWEFSHTSLCN